MKNTFDIKKRRKELNLTLEEVGKFIGVSKSTVKKWESGYIENMKRDKIALLAEILQVSPLAILGITESVTITVELSKEEEKLIKAYRSAPHMQEAVKKLLGVE